MNERVSVCALHSSAGTLSPHVDHRLTLVAALPSLNGTCRMSGQQDDVKGTIIVGWVVVVRSSVRSTGSCVNMISIITISNNTIHIQPASGSCLEEEQAIDGLRVLRSWLNTQKPVESDGCRWWRQSRSVSQTDLQCDDLPWHGGPLTPALFLTLTLSCLCICLPVLLVSVRSQSTYSSTAHPAAAAAAASLAACQCLLPLPKESPARPRVAAQVTCDDARVVANIFSRDLGGQGQIDGKHTLRMARSQH